MSRQWDNSAFQVTRAGGARMSGGRANALAGLNRLQQARYDQDLFFYVVSFGDMAPAAVSVQQLQVQSDSIFGWLKSMAQATLDGGVAPFTTEQIAEVTLQIQDNGGARNLTQGAVPINSIGGTGQLPFINPIERFFQPNTTVQFTATNTSATNTYNGVTFTLAGRKLFEMSGRG